MFQTIIDEQIHKKQSLEKVKQKTNSRNAGVEPSNGLSRPLSHVEIFDFKSQLDEIGSKLKALKPKIEEINKTKYIFDSITIDGGAEFAGNIVVGNIETEIISEEPASNLLADIVK